MSVLHSFERAGELFAEGVIKPEVLISDRLPLGEYPAALAQVKTGAGRKVQVRPHGS
jgi:threonine dehydrogenase-like Zn-dependent dehydrogenase